MIEYKTFAYMDVQKTGSTFVHAFLKKHAGEEIIYKQKHRPVQGEPVEGKLYFITVRDPLAQYSSLFRYGCDSKGRLWNVLRKSDRSDFYERSPAKFAAWLDFVLDPANAEVLGEGYPGSASILGFQSYRFLRLSLPRALPKLARCTTKDDIKKLYEKSNFVPHVLRTESLNDDLKALVDSKLRHAMKDGDKAVAYIDAARQINKSVPDDTLITELPAGMKQRVMDRDWFHFEVLGYPRYPV